MHPIIERIFDHILGFIFIKLRGCQKNYVAKNVGMKSASFSALADTPISSESS